MRLGIEMQGKLPTLGQARDSHGLFIADYSDSDQKLAGEYQEQG